MFFFLFESKLMRAIRNSVIMYLAMFLFRNISSISFISCKINKTIYFVPPHWQRSRKQLLKKCMKIPYALKDLTLYVPEKDDRKSVFGLQHTLKYKWAYYTATNNFQQRHTWPACISSSHNQVTQSFPELQHVHSPYWNQSMHNSHRKDTSTTLRLTPSRLFLQHFSVVFLRQSRTTASECVCACARVCVCVCFWGIQVQNNESRGGRERQTRCESVKRREKFQKWEPVLEEKPK